MQQIYSLGEATFCLIFFTVKGNVEAIFFKCTECINPESGPQERIDVHSP